MKIGVSVEYVFKYIFVAVYKLDHIYIYIYIWLQVRCRPRRGQDRPVTFWKTLVATNKHKYPANLWSKLITSEHLHDEHAANRVYILIENRQAWLPRLVLLTLPCCFVVGVVLALLSFCVGVEGLSEFLDAPLSVLAVMTCLCCRCVSRRRWWWCPEVCCVGCVHRGLAFLCVSFFGGRPSQQHSHWMAVVVTAEARARSRYPMHGWARAARNSPSCRSCHCFRREFLVCRLRHVLPLVFLS